MKFSNRFILILGVSSSIVFAGDLASPIEYVEVFTTQQQKLSIKNLSNEKIEIDIYGRNVALPAYSIVKLNCESYSDLELQIKDYIHGYFEVPCQSSVIFTENFSNPLNKEE